jgi:hypothetical protein
VDDSATWIVPYTTTGGWSTAITFSISSPPSSVVSGSTTTTPPLASGNGTVTVNTSASTPANTYNLTVTAQSGATSRTCPVTLIVQTSGGPGGPGPGGPVNADVTAMCYSSPAGLPTPGPNPNCALANSGAAGFIRWTSTGSDDGRCSVTANTPGDGMATTSTAANPATPVQTQPINDPPLSHTFTATCTSATGGLSDSDTVTFNLPPGAGNSDADFEDSAKHVITANQPGLTTGQLSALNTNPCDGQGRVWDNSYNFKENDLVTFAINFCNTGTAPFVFTSSGAGSSIILTDTIGNLAKPAAGWGAQVSCGNDCDLVSVDDTSQPGKIIFTIHVKPGTGGPNRELPVGGAWTVYYNANPKAPVGATQSHYYFTNCVTNTTVNNLPSAPLVYNNISGQPFDIPGFCMQALFSRSGTAPDRREVAP